MKENYLSRMNRDLRAEVKATYQRIAKEFDASRSSRHTEEFDLIQKLIPEGAKILDVGCGNGRLLAYFQEKNKMVDYTGVDFCPELLAIAKKKHPKAVFVEQDIADLHLEERFDRIVCSATFHHLPTKALRTRALQKIFEHLSDRGILFLSVWNLWQFRYWKVWLSSGLTRDLFIPFGKEKVLRYYHAFFPFEMKSLLTEAGFQIDEYYSLQHNFIFICRKKVLVTPMNPLFVAQKDFVQSSPA